MKGSMIIIKNRNKRRKEIIQNKSKIRRIEDRGEEKGEDKR